MLTGIHTKIDWHKISKMLRFSKIILLKELQLAVRSRIF